MARAGAPFELITRQLGHRDVTMVAKVYGRFKPDTEERDRWERVAAARDREKWTDRVATVLPGTKIPSRIRMKKAPQQYRIARLTVIAGVGLEPTTPAL